MFSKSTLLLLLFCPLMVFAAKGDEEHKVRQTKTFTVRNNSKVQISNKYGKIVVNIWNKQECRADIEITGFGNNSDQARRMAEMVEIKSNNYGVDVKMETVYNASGSGKWFNIGKKDSRDYVNVNYNLFVPANIAALILENNFGDVLARELPMNALLKVNYGFIDVTEASKKLQVHINYTDKCRIGRAEDMEIHANYSNVKVGNARNIELNTNNGSGQFGNVGDMEVRANYDDLKVQSMKSLNLDANYSDVKCEKLNGPVSVRANYSDITLRNMGNDFKNIRLDVTYTDIKLGINHRAQFRVNAQMKNGDFKARDYEWKNVNQVRNNSSLSFSAITANGSDASPVIIINARHSDVKLGGE